jgi:predicted RNase H-like nuclease (RuvC/YqgF family)
LFQISPVLEKKENDLLKIESMECISKGYYLNKKLMKNNIVRIENITKEMGLDEGKIVYKIKQSDFYGLEVVDEKKGKDNEILIFKNDFNSVSAREFLKQYGEYRRNGVKIGTDKMKKGVKI